MAYEVTATRKRPQDFDKLVGQEFVVSTLENALKENRIAHAYLFSGPRGVGKTSSARLLAKALNCEKGPDKNPCGVCDSCVEITKGNSVDVIEIDGASNTSVENIRKIKEEVLYPPQSSRYKIYIIDEVHMLSTSAFNALLKTIEEPPEYLIFIFATTELQKVPATIRSRCQQFRFQLISQEVIKDKLKEAAEDLNIKADEDALYWISKEATGSMRDAYTLFDQVASFSSDHITLDKIKERLNLVGFSQISNIISLFFQKKNGDALSELSKLFEQGVSSEQILKDGAEFFRTLLFYKNGIKRQDLLGESVSDIPQDVVSVLSLEQIEAALRAFIDLYRDLRYSISPRLEVELLFSRLSSLPNLVTTEELVKKLENLKNGIAEGNIVIKKKLQPKVISVQQETGHSEENEFPTSIQKEEEETNIPSMYLEDEEESQIEENAVLNVSDPAFRESVIKKLREKNLGEIERFFSTSTDLKEENNKIIISFEKSFNKKMIDGELDTLKAIFSEILSRDVRIETIVVEPKKVEIKTSDKMKQLQSILGGEIRKTEGKKLDKIKTNEEGNNGRPDQFYGNDEVISEYADPSGEFEG